jgi:hypothetical protein
LHLGLNQGPGYLLDLLQWYQSSAFDAGDGLPSETTFSNLFLVMTMNLATVTVSNLMVYLA